MKKLSAVLIGLFLSISLYASNNPCDKYDACVNSCNTAANSYGLKGCVSDCGKYLNDKCMNQLNNQRECSGGFEGAGCTYYPGFAIGRCKGEPLTCKAQ